MNNSPRLTAALAFALGVALSHCAESGPFVREATWQESMFASVELIQRTTPPDRFPPFVSKIMRGGEPPERVAVELSGAAEVYLFVTGIPDVKWAVADWADVRLLAADGSITRLDPGKTAEVVLGRCEKDLTLRSGLYQKIRLSGKTYDRGLNVQANSIIRVPLNGQFLRFEATIGVDDWAGSNGSVRFAVLGARAAARQHTYERLSAEFPAHTLEIQWEREDGIFTAEPGGIAELAQRYAAACSRVPPLAAAAASLARGCETTNDFRRVRDLYFQSRRLARAIAEARDFQFEDLAAAIADLSESFPNAYPAGRAAALERHREDLKRELRRLDSAGANMTLTHFANVSNALAEITRFKQEALVENPLLRFDELLAIRRNPIGAARRSSWEGFGYGEYLGIPRQSSWNNGTMPNVDRWTNQLVSFRPRLATPARVIFQPDGNRLINDPDLHWNGDKLLFSLPDTNRNWQVCEIQPDGEGFRQLTPSAHRDVHNYNGVYLPSGDIVFLSTAPLQGVPCNSGVIVGMMYKMDRNGGHIRQLTFEQDHDYTPSVMNDGRVLYLRWDYTDTPHVWNRVLMSMNPDGTAQSQYYGGSSYWPNALFFARALPNDNARFVGIVTGHHEGRVGELFIFDPARGRHEISGVVQRIPRRGPAVEAKIEDKLTEHSWPKFLHPWPLSEKYFIVSCKPHPDALWGIYLVDVFDNMVLLQEEEGFALLNPIPLQKRPMPPVIQERTQPAATNALVYIEDVYQGPGLRGVPRGTVHSLRVFSYHFAYQRLAGIDHRVGADGPWEAKRVLGTVPVEQDGSALFYIPAKTPISLQPLDSEGRAVALMRSWISAMPGEKVSCIGCHEQASTVPPSSARRIALARAPSSINGPAEPVHGFGFARDVQPVLDRHCVSCHDGAAHDGRVVAPDLRRDQGGYVTYEAGKLDSRFIPGVAKQELLGRYGAVFDPSYVALRKYVRVGGLESDLHLLPPREFHANTSELIQMLSKGHYNVRLDAAAWARLVTWIDLNAPCHGSWNEVTRIPGDQSRRRLELRALYGGVLENCETSDLTTPTAVEPLMPAPELWSKPEPPALRGWPMTSPEATARQTADGPVTRAVDLGRGVMMEFVRIPAGQFIIGDPDGAPDERYTAVARIATPFWMATREVSNREFQQFKPGHDSRFEHRSSWIFSEEYLGWPLNSPDQPVVRVSWNDAVRFCLWLSERLGETVTLPTEAQWEYACRAGAETPMFYGSVDSDFTPFGNMADASMRKIADEGWRPKAPDLVPRDDRFNDGALVTRATGSYKSNRWGLFDMHGNAAEWTRSTYAPYPYREDDGRNSQQGDRKVVRGGSWRDRPKNCRSASRWGYSPWQEVFNVGFRPIIQIEARKVAQTN